MQEYSDLVAAFGNHFTLSIDTSYFQDVGDDLLGESIPQLLPPRLVTDKVGTIRSIRNALHLDHNEFIFTNEPAIRMFNGYQYSQDLTENSIHNSDMIKFIPKVIMFWVPDKGLYVWSVKDV